MFSFWLLRLLTNSLRFLKLTKLNSNNFHSLVGSWATWCESTSRSLLAARQSK